MRKKSIKQSACIVIFFIGITAPPAGCKDHPANQPGRQVANPVVQKAVEDIYTCPMHPQVIKHQPGNCPICGMTLVKKEFAAAEVKDSGIDLHTLLRPTNSAVISGIPVTTLQQASQSPSIEALGKVDYDTRRIRTIAARISGRIEKLYVNYRYQHVHQGDKIMDIYSPELVTAQQELLFILHNDPGNATLLDAARTKLQWLGMDSRQLQQVTASGKPLYKVTVYANYGGHIHETGNMAETPGASPPMDVSKEKGELPIKEGMYVQKGQTVFQLYNTDQSWIVLNIFAGSSSLVKPGAPVVITPETAPDKPFQASIGYIEPFYRGDSKTLTARVYFDNRSRQLPIGSQVKAAIRGATGPGAWLPREAVLSLGLRQVVLKKENGLFQVTSVQTGIATDSLIQIVSGLSAQDSVAANAQFLMDSESFIKIKEQL
jgi:Cu(I)/Ag(I) efflux system membrane fusion protein